MAKTHIPYEQLPQLSTYREKNRVASLQRHEWLSWPERRQLAYERYSDADIICRRGEFLHDVMVNLRQKIEAGDTEAARHSGIRKEIEQQLKHMSAQDIALLFGQNSSEAVMAHITAEANRMAIIQLGEALGKMPSSQAAETRLAVENMILARDLLAHPAFAASESAILEPHAVLDDLKRNIGSAGGRQSRPLREAVATAILHSPSNLDFKGLHRAQCRTEISLKDVITHAQQADPSIDFNGIASAALRRRRNLLSHQFETQAHDVSIFAHPRFACPRSLSYWIQKSKTIAAAQLGEAAEMSERYFPPATHGALPIMGAHTARLVEGAGIIVKQGLRHL